MPSGHLLTRASHRLCILGETSVWSCLFYGTAFHTMPCLFMPSESTTAGKPWFHLSSKGLRSALSNQTCTTCRPHLHKTNLIETSGGSFHYKSGFSLSGTQLLHKSVSLMVQLLFVQINVLILLKKEINR